MRAKYSADAARSAYLSLYFIVKRMGNIVPDLVRNIRDAAANPDHWTDVFGLLLADARDGQPALTFYREHGGAAQSGVSCNIRCAVHAAGAGAGSPAVRLTVSDGAAKGNLVAEFRFDDEVYGIKADCPSCTACLACSNIGKVREEVASSIRFNRALMAGGLLTACLRTMLDALPDPAFVLSPDGTVAWKNAASGAKEWADAFAATPGKLLALNGATAQASFRAALFEAGRDLGAPAKFIADVHLKTGVSALMIVKAIEPSLPFKSPWVRLFRGAPQIVAALRTRSSRPALSIDTLRKLYALTVKEAELAIALAQGETLRGYAARIGVAFETVRWHSKKLMQKMACRSQQEILHALLYTNTLFSVLG